MLEIYALTQYKNIAMRKKNEASVMFYKSRNIPGDWTYQDPFTACDAHSWWDELLLHTRKEDFATQPRSLSYKSKFKRKEGLALRMVGLCTLMSVDSKRLFVGESFRFPASTIQLST